MSGNTFAMRSIIIRSSSLSLHYFIPEDFRQHIAELKSSRVVNNTLLDVSIIVAFYRCSPVAPHLSHIDEIHILDSAREVFRMVPVPLIVECDRRLDTPETRSILFTSVGGMREPMNNPNESLRLRRETF